MGIFVTENSSYEVDVLGFLHDSGQWDEEFAQAMARELGLSDGLTDEHWQVIHYIRDTSSDQGRCPLFHQTCRHNNLKLADLSRLFPMGYLRGACKLAGVTYRQAYSGSAIIYEGDESGPAKPYDPAKTYTVDVWGFLVHPEQWDEIYAAYRAHDMNMPRLTARHWGVIRSLRQWYAERQAVPTIFEACAINNLTIEQLEELFPDGYHRGVVKLAGLRLW